MQGYQIAIIPGDGVGQEVAVEAKKVLKAVGEKYGLHLNVTEFDWGCDHYQEYGKMMPEDGLKILKGFDAIFLGSVGNAKKTPDHIAATLVMDIRKKFDQYVNLRPIKLYPNVDTLIKTATPDTVDMVVVRENTEGEYSSLGGFFKLGTPEGMALQTAVFTQKGCDRVMRYAFELAEQRKKKGRPGIVTNCTKSNALNNSMVFWDRAFNQMAKNYQGVTSKAALVDALTMLLIRNPEKFDVIVASNLFGDIITDLGAMLQGGIGFAAGGNINPEKDFPSMFEPIHGSAPDIMFKGIVNPIASIESIRMMLEHLEELEAAQDVESAISAILQKGKIRTPDMGGKSKTHELGDAVREMILK